MSYKQFVLDKWNPNLNHKETFDNCIHGLVEEFIEITTESDKDLLINEMGDFFFLST